MFKRILIPTDGSTAANKSAKAGIALASRLGAKVVACYAVEELRPVFGPRLMIDQKMIDEVNKRTREVGQKHVDAIGRMAKAAGVPFAALVTKVYPPHEGIIEAAKKLKCDAIFISTHGRSGLSRLMLGSVTQKVLAQAKIPVVVYRRTAADMVTRARDGSDDASAPAQTGAGIDGVHGGEDHLSGP